jgi:hypothetical protein
VEAVSFRRVEREDLFWGMGWRKLVGVLVKAHDKF